MEKIYARRRRLAMAICLLLVISVSITLSIYPDLLSTLLKVPKQEQSSDSELSKPKKKKITKKKPRQMPKELKDKVVKKKKSQLKKRMITEIKKMQRQVANLEQIERQRMDDLQDLRDPKEDMIERIKEVAEVLEDKAHTFNNKDSSQEATDLDREARELVDDIEKELEKVAKEENPTDPSGKPANEEELKDLSDKAEDLAKRLDEASKKAESGEPKQDAEQASMAAEDVAKNLEKLAENDTSEMTEGLADSETNPMRSETRPLDELSIKELHDLSQDLAAHANDLHTDIKAAEDAKEKNMPFNDSLASKKLTDYQKNKLDGQTPSTPKSNNTEANPEGETMDDFANFTKDAMKGIQQAARSINRNERMSDPAMRAAAIAAAMGGGGKGGFGSGTGQGKRGEGFGGKARSGPDDPLRLQSGGTWNQTNMKWRDAVASAKYHFSHEQLRDILPARRFSKESLRKGWFYIDTWYVIGPWKAPWADGRVDYRVQFPPEHEIDLEADYGEGQDGERLVWKFKQFDSVLMAMDPQWRDSAYFLYTELYFEEDTEMVLSVAADDTAKVWVNDQVVIEEDTMSDWALNESYSKVRFHRGFNKVLVRQQNGPGETDLSVIICAEEIITR
ncbi:hypothetical protein HW115_13695 [Verrucomicrobiaceae bacterium N1E253]|uniref:PA14 domain-containing protein n=1 Tax=Oceaniferula marina TaxID=2748318 RepID=A0A851GLG0_9BACT|nr:hypothetical protein [Oceaniferula marina]NWK56671.1 hypothetical protein [Oceaniferula marina]